MANEDRLLLADKVLQLIEPKFCNNPVFTVSRDILLEMIADVLRTDPVSGATESYIGSDQERAFLEKKALGDLAGAAQEEQSLCGEVVTHLIAGASWFTCALPKGHADEGHRASGTCFKHGKYLGEPFTMPQCPKWPDCILAADPIGAVAPQPPKVRACNRHSDCDHFDAEYKARRNVEFVPYNQHCHDEDCEDCFGQ